MVNRILALRRKSDFKSLAQKGKTIRISSWLLVKYQENDLSTNRFGWSISRKVANAVIRNRLKRWCREYFRHKVSKKYYDFNIILVPQKGAFYKHVERDKFNEALEQAWQKIR